ncbi:enhanced intracellular survival protein Eis [Natrialbaceae archaeon GCM10025810]|uniref:GNAT family N-acetyltransferase n=1 Tax=Halovalidus salilacus TaxID=3075124 RepID=UPI0036168634
MTDYRPLEDDPAAFHEYRSYAFSPGDGPVAYDPNEHETRRTRLGERRGLYVEADDVPRCVCRHYWLEARVRGEDHPAAGLASVATPPEYRRRGYVARLLERSLEEYRERGSLVSILWPFGYAFYRRYGWETANRLAIHECDPSVLSFAREEYDREDGRFRRLEARDFSTLEAAYVAHRDRYAISLERDEAWWRHRIFDGHGTAPFVYAYERDGDVRGYLVYEIEDRSGDETRRGRTMAVSELVAVDHDALLALLAFCADHDPQVERVRFRVPEDLPIRETVRDPDEVETALETGPMVRLVDAAETLSALSYPPMDANLTLAVEDPLVEWNDATFELSVADGRATCERLVGLGDADPDTSASVDARLDVAALSQLVVGARTASDLERTGRLETHGPETTSTLETLFPEAAVYLGHHF